MKTAGIVIVVIGLLITIVTGLNFVTKEKVVEIGELEVTKDKDNRLSWSPIIGVIVMAVGGGVVLLAMRKS